VRRLWAVIAAGELALTDAEREMLVILRQSMSIVVGPAADTKDRRFALDAIRVIDSLLARASGQTSGQESLAQNQSAPENTPACSAQEPAKQTVTLTDAERVAIAWAVEVSDSLAECGGAGISPGATNKTSATLRGLLARTTKEGAR
jgi:hypothetical protein